jgi:outer membrane protein assembly factor BamB
MSFRNLLILSILFSLTACGQDGWFGKAGDPILPGTRVPVLVNTSNLVPDASLMETEVTLPEVVANNSWPQAGGNSMHYMQHVALSATPKIVWQTSIGQGSNKSGFLVHPPVAAQGRAFVMDTRSRVTSVDLKTGARIWTADLTPDTRDETIASGGLATDGTILYATTGQADLVAVNAVEGKILWRQPVSSPLRAAPTVSNGRIFIIGVDNRLMSLNAKDGSLVWSYDGVNESAALLGGASAAVDAGVVVAPFSSGDIAGLRLDNGRQLWQESLFSLRRSNSMEAITAIRAMPVVFKNVVFAIGHGGRMVALDLATGGRRWELPIGGTQTPWLAGDFLYVITNNEELVCIEADGRIKWVTSLPSVVGDKKYHFSGPILAGGKLYVSGSDAKLYAITPEDGVVRMRADLPSAASVPPVVVDGTLLVLTDSGQLVAFR